MLAFPDASTFQVLPWRPESNAVARMLPTGYAPEALKKQMEPEASHRKRHAHTRRAAPKGGPKAVDLFR